MKELLIGVGAGIGAGIAPGPLLSLVVASTLQRGFGAGVRVALAPLVTDGPIVVLTVLTVGALPGGGERALAGAGAAYLLHLGWQTLRRAPRATLADPGRTPSRRDLWQGVVANALKPHPWLFWLGAGAPILDRAWSRAPLRGAAFLAGFYGLLVGSKILLAAAVAVTRRRVGERWYRAALAAAGALLVVMAALLLWEVALPTRPRGGG